MLHDLDTFARHLVDHGISPKAPPYVGIPGNSPAIAWPSRLLRQSFDGMTVTDVSVSSVDAHVGNGPLYSLEVSGHTTGKPSCRRRYKIHAVSPDFNSRRDMRREQIAWAERQRASRIKKASGWTRHTVEAETEDEGFVKARRVLRKAGLTVDGASVRHEASGKEVLTARNDKLAIQYAERILRDYPTIDWTLGADELLDSMGDEVKTALGRIGREAWEGQRRL